MDGHRGRSPDVRNWRVTSAWSLSRKSADCRTLTTWATRKSERDKDQFHSQQLGVLSQWLSVLVLDPHAAAGGFGRQGRFRAFPIQEVAQGFAGARVHVEA